ncbi:MAG: L-seryl-tRNA(Sec) selenium transferase, partial [Deltaproteobacteria bacterium]|nr:L-seryl-tRNA(Sec) selenium transferase [Deltaproteobacteria bacterium]
AEALAEQLRDRGLDARVAAAAGLAGGGALPGVDLEGFVVRLSRPSPGDDLARLRRAPVPVIARVEDDALVLDPRTLLPGDDAALVEALAALPR